MRLSRNDAAVLDALLPAGANSVLTLGIAGSGFEAFLIEFHRQSPPRLWRAFRLALWTAGWIGPLLVRRMPPIGRLSNIDRAPALAAMEDSPVPELRQLVRVLKTVVSLHYGGLPAVRQAIGYP